MGDYTMYVNGSTVKSARLNGLEIKEIRDANTQTVLWQKKVAEYFYFEDISGNANTLTLTKYNNAPTVNLEYSTDQTNWQTWDENNNVRTYTIPANGKFYLRGDNTAFGGSSNDDYYHFGSNGSINANGNLMTLLDKSGNLKTAGNYAFRRLFQSWTNLKKPPYITATTAGNHSFSYTFAQSGITTSPEIFVTSTTGDYTFANMCYNCKSLTDAGTIHTTDLSNSYTFYETFYGCSALANVPSFTLNSISGGTNHCMYMFRDCTSITDGRNVKLNAQNLGVASLRGMYFHCTSLSIPSEIKATSLSDGNGDTNNGSLAQMFYNCSNLGAIMVHFTSWNGGNCTHNWTYGTKSSGQFYKPTALQQTKNASGNTTDANYIPYNWNVISI